MVGQWILMSLAVVAVSQDDGTLTLDEAVRIAEQQAFSIRLAESDIDIAKAQVKVAEGQLLPGAQVVGTSTWLNANNSSQFGQNGSLTTSSVQLQVSKIIDISGVYRNRILSARFNREAQEAAFQSQLNMVRGGVKEAFFSVVQARELVQVQESALEAAVERLEKARIREQEGAIPRFDVLRFEVEVKRAEQAVSDARGNYELAKQNLNNVLGRPIETPFEVEASPVLPQIPTEAEPLVGAALQKRPEIDQAQLGIKALEEARKAEGKAAAPSLTASGAFTKNIDPGFGQADDTTTLGLTLNWPIVISGVVAANTRVAEEREKQAKIQFEQLQLGIALEVQSALTAYRTAVEGYETAVKNLELAEEALRLAQLRYDESVGILLDVTTSQADVTSARASVAIAAFQIRTAFANLQRAVGQDNLNDLESLLEKKD